jgi:formate dehydrogenase iron-sulfur subunit
MPWIVEHGAAAYAALGSRGSTGTKLLSLNSLFCRPGLYEVEFGITLRDIVERLGQGLRRGTLLGVMLGGPLAALIPPRLLDTPFEYEALRAIGASVGHGGVIAFDDDTDIAGLAAEVFNFGAFESCGRCTPCAFGAAELARLASRAAEGEYVDGARWRELVDALAAASLCGHGRGLAEFAAGLQRHYPEELSACFA